MIFLDFETRSDIDLIKMGATRYALSEMTQALCMSWLFDDQPAPTPEDVPLWHRGHAWEGGELSPRPDELIERIRSGELVEAHNARFEFLIWNHVLRREFPEFDVEIKLEQLRCSAAKASCMSLPRSLGDAVVAVNLEQRKDADGNRLINKLSKPMRMRRKKIAPGEYAWKTAVRYEILDLFGDEGAQTPGWAALYALGEEVASWYGAAPIKRNAAIRDLMHRMRDENGYFTEAGTGRYVRTSEPIAACDVPPDRDARREVIEAAAARQQETQTEVQWCEEEIEHRRNWRYNQQDVRAERGLSEYCPEMSERELQYWQMDFRMNERGVQLDYDTAKAAIDLCDKEVLRLNDEMFALTDGAVIGGSKRIPFRKWANEQIATISAAGYPVGPIPDTRADTLSFMLYGVPTKAGEDAKLAAKPRMDAQWESWGELGKKLRRAMMICLEVNRSSVAKYRQMMGSVCKDGRLHDIMLYNGADRTGRWSGKGVQPHNFVRGYMADMDEIWKVLLSADTEMVEIVTGDLMLPAMAKACRGALTASWGKELYAADFNAIEARKLAWMSGCEVLLSLFRNNGDPYCDMATAIYKREITKKDKSERQLGKKAILGLGYAMGWEKFQATVWAEEGIWLEDEFCQEVVRIYRKIKYPEIPKLWKVTNEAAINAVVEGGEFFAGGNELGDGAISYFMSKSRDFLHCRLPSGRLLAYLYPEVHTKISYRYNAINERGKPCVLMFPAKVGVPMNRVKYHAQKLAEKQRKTLTDDPPESFLQPHLSFMGRDTYTRQWKRMGTHGGTLVENADQASSRDLLAESMWRVDQTDEFDLLLSIHDEVIAEAPIGTMPLKDFEALMAVVPAWAPGMPIGAEGWIGPRLRK